ncbi:molybdate transport regulatory protein ModE [Syntrophotalea carbinolica DSM 2380]|uniref:Molybdate transport regulatory protein ModE n=1 Tax=Syntrophotalea carbinolica (strain DSM 2380 / NBRC 103641 / GraBd1) TaxID=338963 RepID=Q3A6T6_SYNC1|nr:TOBE domain-containing protein [Syntrophotalea carbinolica]ABA87921.1 molybdate transport regulatory protein ModE [Syntrophotalea carbinolica DSM 2380]
MKNKKTADLSLTGSLWFKKSGQDFLGSSRIQLLEKVGELGSITKAGKAVGISYKTAWEQVEMLNNLSDQPLVIKQTGGRGGGGTRLTEAGKEVIHRYRLIQKEHERFLRSIGEHLEDGEGFYQFLRKVNMKVSARNIWSGEITQLEKGAINTLVTLKLKGGDCISSLITNESVESLDLALGEKVVAMAKAPAVMIVKELGAAQLSACNILRGTIQRIVEAQVDCEVTLELPGGNTVSATLTKASGQSLELREGEEAWAVVQESSVILGRV